MFLFINATKLNKIEAAIFLIKEDKVEIVAKKSSKAKSDKILILIDKLLKEQKTALKKIKAVFAVDNNGPFTAIRISIAVASALNISLKIPVFKINSQPNKNIKNLIESNLSEIKKIKL
ncbi:hypothetical protein KAS41_03400 [Candidatus Parcubacteria bacterium]|nr:hypothetical protein [Candidatus Parcubacteria bacterium]